MVKMKVKGADMAKLKQRLANIWQGLGGNYVTVGVHKDALDYPNGESVAMVALINEFGAKKEDGTIIPERSFLRSAVHENQGAINKWRVEVLKGMAEKKITAHKALTIMGFRMQVLVQNKIKSNVPPSNAQVTLDRKKELGQIPETLRATEHMLRHIGYQVYLKGNAAGGVNTK